MIYSSYSSRYGDGPRDDDEDEEEEEEEDKLGPKLKYTLAPNCYFEICLLIGATTHINRT